MADENLKVFLPPENRVIVKNPSAKPPSEGDSRDIGLYGRNLLDDIYKDYQLQITDWKNSFGKVMGSFHLAVERRNRKLEEAARERERDAAIGAFILQLLTAGSMSFIAAWVEHAFVPSLTKMTKIKDQFLVGPKGFESLVKTTKTIHTQRFSELQAIAFGKLTHDLGDLGHGALGIPRRWRTGKSDFPQPQTKDYPIDTPAGVDLLKTDLQTDVDDSGKVLLSQLADAESWMNKSTDFGTAWIDASQGDSDKARAAILRHFTKRRDEWADNWEFFGRVPSSFTETMLAEEYERGLWAAYFKWRLSPAGMNDAEKAFFAPIRRRKVAGEPHNGPLEGAERLHG
jgi:hypothetical protein